MGVEIPKLTISDLPVPLQARVNAIRSWFGFAILAFCLFDLDLGQTAFEVVYQKFNSSKHLADVWMDFLVAT